MAVVVVNSTTYYNEGQCKDYEVFLYRKEDYKYDYTLLLLDEYLQPILLSEQSKMINNSKMGRSITTNIIKLRYYQSVQEYFGLMLNDILKIEYSKENIDKIICDYGFECIKYVLKNYFNDNATYIYMMNLLDNLNRYGIGTMQIESTEENVFKVY